MISRKALLILIILSTQPLEAKGANKSICDQNDERILSETPEVGRVLDIGADAGCTLTLIGKSCAISAGHCLNRFEEVHFNTPPSRDFEIQRPGKEDIYYIDSESIDHVFEGRGQDFAVMKIMPNKKTGLWPGQVQGYLPVNYEMLQGNEILRITGYGRARKDPKRNFAQQTHTGEVYRIDLERGILFHRVDTTGGNSGSAVVNEASGEIVGIHTHPGCNFFERSANASTLFAHNNKLQNKINNCLEWEKENL